MLGRLTESEKEELVVIILKELNGTIREFFPKDTVINTGLVIKVVELTLTRIAKEQKKKDLDSLLNINNYATISST